MALYNSLNLTGNGIVTLATSGVFSFSTVTQYRVLLGSSSNTINQVNSLGTSGQVLTSNGVGAEPSWEDTAVAFTWTTITGNTNAAVNNGYIVTSGSPIVTLPTTSAVGDIIAVMLNGGTTFTIQTGASATIQIGSVSQTANPASIQPTGDVEGACVYLLCTVADSTWVADRAPVGSYNFSVI